MLSLLLSLTLLQSSSGLSRDAYGAPIIRAASWEEAFRLAGYAVAQDRLWQMENSRRLAQGRMAEAFGSQYVASDREILRLGYTEDELQSQLDALSARAKSALEQYARGVNDWIKEAKAAARLPEGYANAGLEPEPWTPIDSVAISISLFQQFGRGGSGELRNLALLTYLQTQARAKDRLLDILDDFVWFNDSASPTTVKPEDDPLAGNHPKIRLPTRAETERHFASLPKPSLLELIPGIRLASAETSRRVAELRSVPFKVGSYCVVVGASRSASGSPILLSAPQMGFRTPSIVHEMSIEAPGLAVVGMDVPGVPGVVIGHTKDFAWGLTSGIADTDDIFFYRTEGEDAYHYGRERKAFTKIPRPLKVKGGEPQTVVQSRTLHGPVIVTSKTAGAVFARRSSYWMQEMRSFEALLGLYSARSPAEIEATITKATMSFNFFYATQKEIGYRYVGNVPIRAAGVDPRLPAPGDPAFEWQGFIPPGQMPRVRNPKQGLIANWNNKPATWWPNGDTPAWGRIFRADSLFRQLEKAKLSTEDVELAAWQIARQDLTFEGLKKWFAAGTPGANLPERLARSYSGRRINGSMGLPFYSAWVEAVREELFVPSTGNLMGNLAMAAQPSVILAALEGRTKFNYLQGRRPEAIARESFKKGAAKVMQGAGENLAGLRAQLPGIPFGSTEMVPYPERGTYIQIVDLLDVPLGRNVLPPGVAETGPHSRDQIALAREWSYKNMRDLGKP